ncbi:signal peptidase II [Agarilytica rhodophyticola]|uniref:signal peptidase II n=1 Tax=Agarilytica rhodophyticola TaxID=1737490 RepID=UPI000B34877B
MNSVSSTHRLSEVLPRIPWKWYALSFVIIVLDLISKKIVSDSFELYERLNVLPFFDITLRHNSGAAFSFLAGQGGWQIWFFSILSFAVSVVLIVWIFRAAQKNIWEVLALSLVLGGAVGNLYDRVTLGYVVDFILVYYQEYQFPAFNVADSAISVGAAILILDTLFNKEKEDKDN